MVDKNTNLATVVASHLLRCRQVSTGVERIGEGGATHGVGVKGAMPAAASRPRMIPATPSSASRRSPVRLPQTARPNSGPASHPHPPAIHRRLQLYQKMRGLSILIALSARTMILNISSSTYDPRSRLCWTDKPGTIG